MHQLKSCGSKSGERSLVCEMIGIEYLLVHDTDMAIRVAVEAIRKMIKEDQAK